MRRENRWRAIIVVLALVSAVIVLGVMGYQEGQKNDSGWTLPVKQGLDLRGGVYVVLGVPEEAARQMSTTELNEALRQAKVVIDRRVNELGVAEPIVQLDLDSSRIIVQLPGVKTPEEAAALVGRTAQLIFEGPSGETIITGQEVREATPGPDQQRGGYQIVLRLTPEGQNKFGEATTRLVGRPIVIRLDEDVLITATVNSGNLREPVITGLTATEARENSILINAGALPVPLERIASTVVGPTLGQQSVRSSMIAGIVGIVLVFAFMFVFYLFSGFFANVSLVLYAIMVLAILALFRATLTLPGIAGFILSIGMAVDANVIIFERIKEELRSGRRLRAAIDMGFNRAFWTIVDANVTTLIAAFVLLYFGTGPVKGFAVTLSIGILTSMFTAIFVTRVLMQTVVDRNPERYERYFGVRG